MSVLLAVIAASGCLGVAASELPKHVNQGYAEFPGDAPLVGRPAEPLLETADARRYRTRLRQGAAKGPNFNGHYRLVSWGCGTNCIGWAVIDLASGTVWMGPTEYCAGSRVDPKGERRWVESAVTSRLIFVNLCGLDHECPPETPVHRRAYVWRETSAEPIGTQCVEVESRERQAGEQEDGAAEARKEGGT